MQNFKNVINECLVKADPDELVCNVLPLPELHLLLGFVTHLHKILYRVWPHILIWGRGKWTVHGRHGGGLDGANSMKLLRKLDELGAAVPRALIPIVNLLKKFKSIVDGCFGWDLCWDYKERISSFTAAFLKLQAYVMKAFKVKLTTTWKIHMVCAHLQPLLTRLRTGLAVVCEQAGEAVHSKFKATRSRYKRNKYHSNHGKAQKSGVVHWSSWNVKLVNKNTIQKYREKFRSRRYNEH